MTSSVLLKFADDRRVRGDMITTYRIMTGKDKVDPGLFFDMVADGEGLRTRRGTGVFNIRGSNDRLDISQRVVNTWNSLPDSLKGVGGSAGLQEPREGQWREDRDPERVPLRDAHGCDHWDRVQDYTPW